MLDSMSSTVTSDTIPSHPILEPTTDSHYTPHLTFKTPAAFYHVTPIIDFKEPIGITEQTEIEFLGYLACNRNARTQVLKAARSKSYYQDTTVRVNHTLLSFPLSIHPFTNDETLYWVIQERLRVLSQEEISVRL